MYGGGGPEDFCGGHEIFYAYIDRSWNILQIFDGLQNIFLSSVFSIKEI